MIKTLIFDMGNVLLYFSHEKAIAQIAKLCGRSFDEIKAFLFDSGLEWRYEEGEITTDELLSQLEDFAGRPLSKNDLVVAASDIFELNEPMIDILARAKASGCRLVLLSNTNEAHYRFIAERYDFLEHFDAQILSFKVGACKPRTEIFHAALEAAACEPGACYYTDDIAEYIEVAEGLGMKGICYTDPESYLAKLGELGIILPTEY